MSFPAGSTHCARPFGTPYPQVPHTKKANRLQNMAFDPRCSCSHHIPRYVWSSPSEAQLPVRNHWSLQVCVLFQLVTDSNPLGTMLVCFQTGRTGTDCCWSMSFLQGLLFGGLPFFQDTLVGVSFCSGCTSVREVGLTENLTDQMNNLLTKRTPRKREVNRPAEGDKLTGQTDL